MDYSPPGSSVRVILQARILEWVAISFTRGSSQLRDRTQVFYIAGRFFTHWATLHMPLPNSEPVHFSFSGYNCCFFTCIQISQETGQVVCILISLRILKRNYETPNIYGCQIAQPLKRTSDQIRSVSQSCLTLCDPMNRSTPGLPVHHQLPEVTQTHVHQIRDAIQPSHPLSSPSPLVPHPSQHQSLFQWVNSSHEVAKVLEFQL